MNVSKIMSSQVVQITPNTTVSEAATLMRQNDVGVLPVCDDNNSIVGIVTDRDLVVRLMSDSVDPAKTPVKKAVTSEVVCVSPDTDCEIAADLMAQEKIRRLPVVDSNGKVVGMLSLGDMATINSMDATTGEVMHEICSCPGKTGK